MFGTLTEHQPVKAGYFTMRHDATKTVKGDVIARQTVLDSEQNYNERDFVQTFGAEKSFMTELLKELCSVILDSAKEGDVPTMIENIQKFTDIIYTRLDEIHFSKKEEFISSIIVEESIVDILLKLFGHL